MRRLGSLCLVLMLALGGCGTKDENNTVDEPAGPVSPAESPVAAVSSVSFVTFGDWGTGDDNQKGVATAIGDYCATESCEFILTLGDNFYSSGVEDTDDDQWESKYHAVYDFLGLPFAASLGNHDNDGNIQAEIDYSKVDPDWYMPAENYSFARPEGSSSPLVEFFVFNSDYPHFRDSSVQGWLDEAIAASQATWKILVMHHPIYSDGKHGDDEQGNNDYLFPIICGRIDLVLSGHDHNFSYLKKDAAGCPIEQLVVGTGGASIRTNVTKTEATVVKRGDIHGFGWLQATSDQISFRMIQDDGGVFYTTEWTK